MDELASIRREPKPTDVPRQFPLFDQLCGRPDPVQLQVVLRLLVLEAHGSRGQRFHVRRKDHPIGSARGLDGGFDGQLGPVKQKDPLAIE